MQAKQKHVILWLNILHLVFLGLNILQLKFVWLNIFHRALHTLDAYDTPKLTSTFIVLLKIHS
jgi:hypothetical protein